LAPRQRKEKKIYLAPRQRKKKKIYLAPRQSLFGILAEKKRKKFY